MESRCNSTKSGDHAKKVTVEYLYLDMQSCDRCIGTDRILDEVMQTLTPALVMAGFAVDYKKMEIETAEIATQFHFVSSPTIRVNGQDICHSVAENNCGCCSQISDTDVDCRVFKYHGERFEVPPREMLAEAILQTVFDQFNGKNVCTCSGGRYELPANLKRFFDGKKNKLGCSCSGNCC